MPIYPFKCECGAGVDLICKIADYDELKDHIFCPDCSKRMSRVFSPLPIHGLEWNYLSKGYHPERDDPTNEIRFDMKKLEEKTMETGNLERHRMLKKALGQFAEAHEDIL